MNLKELRRKLLAAARTQSPPEHVPYAFEKRVMAMLSSRPVVVDLGALWAGALWRAAGPCIAVMVFLAAWSFFAADGRTDGRTPVTDLSQDFENTLLAVADQEPPSDSIR
jgi:hypothetical protein